MFIAISTLLLVTHGQIAPLEHTRNLCVPTVSRALQTLNASTLCMPMPRPDKLCRAQESAGRPCTKPHPKFPPFLLG